MKDKPRLGRGIEALFQGAAVEAEAANGQTVVAIDRIQQNPFQPRKAFDTEELDGLCESIKTHGLLQPLVVRQVGETFQLVAGERRWRAARTAGKTEVPVVVVDFNDRQTLEAALAENIQRADLNPIEKAQGFKEYLDRFNVTQEDLAGKLGVDRTTISNLIGLLDLAPEVQDAVRVKQISLGHAKVLKGIKDGARQVTLCKEVIARGHSVHALETLIKQPKAEADTESKPAASTTAKPAVEKTSHVQGIEDDLRKSLAARVEIRLREKDKGQIILSFESDDDFQRLLDVLRK
ncbi:MAG: ParB/RepB/Spo0J family partition protein [Planctomycetia bacterium]|nr:ParB/RepB/Spo0J family partition protein [Planctomycetia bacterium]